MVILPATLQAREASNLLQNVRSISSVRTKDLSAPIKLVLDNRVNSTVMVRGIFNFLMTRNHLFPLDSCIGPDDYKDLRDTSGRGLNVNGSICLNFVCQYVFGVPSMRSTSHLFRFANVTAGSTCEIENTGYIAYGSSGEFVYVVSRYGPDQSYSPIFSFTVLPQR